MWDWILQDWETYFSNLIFIYFQDKESDFEKFNKDKISNATNQNKGDREDSLDKDSDKHLEDKGEINNNS